jgi:hypothetical protein
MTYIARPKVVTGSTGEIKNFLCEAAKSAVVVLPEKK